MIKYTNKTFSQTYRDSFDEKDNYHRVLFNAGRALQARELIEMQSIIQAEIARFGRNLFKEGAMVNPGGVTVDNKLEYLRLSSATVLPTDLTSLHGVQFVSTRGIVVEIVEMLPLEGSDPVTAIIKYVDTTAVTTNPDVSVRITDNETLTADTYNELIPFVDTIGNAPPVSGLATKAHFDTGDFFVQGHFVNVQAGSVYISKYSSTPTDDIGFLIEQNIITESDNENLFDNQGDVPNRTSPGAHRYQINLTPTTRSKVLDSENFVYVARVVNGVITREVDGTDDYNRLNDLLAVRTKEESGDYVAKPFKAVFNNGDTDNLVLDITEGTAYVDGYRLAMNQTNITVPKARDTVLRDDDSVPANYGNWVYFDETSSAGLASIHNFGQVNLFDVDGEVIGTANVRGIEQDAAGYRAYIFNIKMTNGKNFADTVKMGELPLVTPQVYGAVDNNLLFPLPNTRPKQDSINFATYTIQRARTFTSDASGSLTLNGVEYANWVIAEVDGPVLPIATVNGTYTGLTPNKDHQVISYEEVTSAPRSKVLKTTTVLKTIVTAEDRYEPINLGLADGVRIVSVKQVLNSETTDITFMFTLDGGQRDNFYDLAQAKLSAGNLLPSDAVIKVTFEYFEHLDDGKYFAATSYTNIDYAQIPSHTLSTGQVVSLRDVLDFRPTRQPDGSFKITELPQNASSVTVDQVEYYLPRIDVLVANSIDSKGRVGKGELQVIHGESALEPRAPSIPTGSLALYTFLINPYTFDKNDLTSTLVKNKRFTMKDIARLEERVEDLYELTTLSLLEANTNNLTVVDENGNARTKAGFIADNFTSFNFTDVFNPEFRASLHLQDGELRPSFREQSVSLKVDTSNTANTASLKGDLVTLPFAHNKMVSQLLATSTMNVNPFAVITQTGHMTLSPASDQWVETRRLPDVIQTAVRRTSSRSGKGRRVQVTTTSTTIQELLGERVVDIEIVPFMRSRKIYFSAKGLRPNTNMYAFFGNKEVNAWVRPEEQFVHFSQQDNPEVGSQYSSATGHPDGSGQLVTDDKGELVGSFFLPNTSEISFRTGTQDLKLFDVNVNDIEKSITNTSATYTSVGTIEAIERTIRSTRVVNSHSRYYDPLAQTFIVDQVENPNGIFLTRASIFVESKDSVIPLQVQIRAVENGVPTGDIVPGGVKFISPTDINAVPYDPASTTLDGIKASPTIVEFDEPIYLTPGEEYAIVLLAESIKYNVYVAQTYEFTIGPNNREQRVTKQPTLGTLFLSQNGSTWTPDQTKDLMFELDRAEFSQAATLIVNNAPLPMVTLQEDPFVVTKGQSLVRVSHQGHGFTINDEVTISNVTSPVGGISASALNGVFRVINPTWQGYTINLDPSQALPADPLDGLSQSVNTIVYNGAFADFSSNNGWSMNGQGDFDGTVITLGNTYLISFELANVVGVAGYMRVHPDDAAVFSSMTGQDGWGLIKEGGFASPTFQCLTAGSYTFRLQLVNSNSQPYAEKIVTVVVSANTSYDPTAAYVASSSARGGGSTVNASQQAMFDEFIPQFQSIMPRSTNMTAVVAKATGSSYGGNRSDNILVLPYQKLESQVFLNEVNYNNSPCVVATDVNATNTLTFKINMTTGDTKVSPVIDMQRASMLALENIIDGGDAAQHITTPIVLQEASVGLKVLFGANRPSAAKFEVYIKTAVTEDNLDDASWLKLDPEIDMPADDNPETVRQYEYLAGGDAGTMESFSAFQVKIVMKSTNSSQSPTIKDLRVIALAV